MGPTLGALIYCYMFCIVSYISYSRYCIKNSCSIFQTYIYMSYMYTYLDLYIDILYHKWDRLGATWSHGLRQEPERGDVPAVKRQRVEPRPGALPSELRLDRRNLRRAYGEYTLLG